MARSIRIAPVVVTSALLLCAVIAAFGWLALRVTAAATHLTALAQSGRDLVAAADGSDMAAVAVAARAVGDHARAAAAATEDPLWAVAEAMPLLGDDFGAVRTLSAHTAELADAVLDPLLAAAGSPTSAAAPDAETLSRIGRDLNDAGVAVTNARDAVAELHTAGLLPPIRAAAEQLRDALTVGVPTVDALAAVASLGGALTSDEEATVLVMLQNPAEVRTGGGITGSFVLLRAQEGRFALVDQADSTQFPERATSILPVGDARTALYGDVVGRFVQNASMPTTFSESAALARAWWTGHGGAEPDAVVSLDPLALRGLLASTGPVDLPDGSVLTADNLVDRILLEPYLRYDSTGQTAYLQAVTTALFERVTELQTDAFTWARALAEPIGAGRLALWSADPAVQAAIDGSILDGVSGRVAAAGDDAFAVLFNDATGGKMDTFLHVDMELIADRCRSDGRAEVLVRLTMSSSAPDAASLPPSMTGHGLFGTGIGDIGTSVSVAAPPGTFFGGVTKDGEREISVDVVDAGRPTSLVRINLSPAEVNVVEFRFIAAEPGPLDLGLVHTPLINPSTVRVAPAVCG